MHAGGSAYYVVQANIIWKDVHTLFMMMNITCTQLNHGYFNLIHVNKQKGKKNSSRLPPHYLHFQKWVCVCNASSIESKS